MHPTNTVIFSGTVGPQQQNVAICGVILSTELAHQTLKPAEVVVVTPPVALRIQTVDQMNTVTFSALAGAQQQTAATCGAMPLMEPAHRTLRLMEHAAAQEGHAPLMLNAEQTNTVTHLTNAGPQPRNVALRGAMPLMELALTTLLSTERADAPPKRTSISRKRLTKEQHPISLQSRIP